jgi:hypothetical protein
MIIAALIFKKILARRYAVAKETSIKFQLNFANLQKQIEIRNLQREQPFMSFCPNHVPCSVFR